MGLDDLVTDHVFSWQTRKDGKLVILYKGKQVMISKGIAAENLLADLLSANKLEEQYLLARVTGNFKRGNERLSKNQPKYN